jgi:hypothetical protein
MSMAVALAEKRWWTYAEAAGILGWHPDSVRRMIRKKNFKSRKVRQGQHPRRIRQISSETLEKLRYIARQ